jgi:hypothetical protein
VAAISGISRPRSATPPSDRINGHRAVCRCNRHTACLSELQHPDHTNCTVSRNRCVPKHDHILCRQCTRGLSVEDRSASYFERTRHASTNTLHRLARPCYLLFFSYILSPLSRRNEAKRPANRTKLAPRPFSPKKKRKEILGACRPAVLGDDQLYT